MVNVIDETIGINIDILCVPATVENGRFDVDEDGYITWMDANIIWQHRTGPEMPYDMKYDMNCDGTVNYQDAGLCWLNRDFGSCEDITDEEFCGTIGCFWYDGGCHSAIEEGQADAQNVSYPTPVEPETEIIIEYDVENLGGEDTIWGELYEDDQPVPGTYWEEIFLAGEIKPKTIIIAGIIEPFIGELRVGHAEE